MPYTGAMDGVAEKLVRGGTLGLLLMVLAMGLCDAPIGAIFAAHPVQGAIGEFFDAAEQFGTPFGQIILLLILSRLMAISPSGTRCSWDPRVLRIFVTTVLAGLSANVGKLLVARTRPREFDFALPLVDGFGDWFPLGHGGNGIQSFPSAHTASAFGFAVALGWLWPKHRVLFFCLAILVGLQRISVAAHFPSDVIAGATLGFTVATLYLSNGWIDRIWRAIEDWCWRMQGIIPEHEQNESSSESSVT